MPLYGDLGYYPPSVYAPNRSPVSSSPYSPYSRLNPYTPPPPLSIYGKDGQYKPMLTSISEVPSSFRPNPLTSLTRINSGSGSGKHYNYLRPYVSPRPIQINTADIDVSASKYRKNRNARVRSTSPETVKDGAESSPATNSADTSVYMPRVDQNDAAPARATIKRDRHIVRLSTMRQRSHSRSNRSSRGSKKDSKISSPTSSTSGSTKKQRSFESPGDDQSETSASNTVNKSWRDKFGDSLLTNAKRVQRKSPGELILERHIIRDKGHIQKEPAKPKTTVHIPDNVTPQEITYLEPLIRKSIRRQSLVTCPSFKDICKDISSDIKDEDDLNAGDLRRRASVILEQESQILAQLAAISNRRPSADVVVDEAIAEEEPSDEKENEEKKDVEKVEEPTPPTPNVENVIVIKKKTKKKGGKLTHKITVSVEVENPTLNVISSSNVDNAISDEKRSVDVAAKKSPTWRAVVEEIKEDVVVNLPRKSTRNELKVNQSTENDEDFWHLLGRRESACFKKRVDLRKNELEIIEIIDPDDGASKEKSDKSEKKTVSTQKKKTEEKLANLSKSADAPLPDAKKSKPVQLKIDTANVTKPKRKVSIELPAVDDVKKNDEATASPVSKPDDGPKTCEQTSGTKAESGAEKIASQSPPMESKSNETIIEQANNKNNESVKTPVTATSNEMADHQHKQTDKSNAKSPMMMQTSDPKIENGLSANKTEPAATEAAVVAVAETVESTQNKSTKRQDSAPMAMPIQQPTKETTTKTTEATAATATSKPTIQNSLVKNDAKTVNNASKNANEKPKAKKVVKKTKSNEIQKAKSVDKGDENAEQKERQDKKVKKDTKLPSSVNDKISDVNTTMSANQEPIGSIEKSSEKAADTVNEIASATVENTQIEKSQNDDENESNLKLSSALETSNSSNIGGLSKFPTVANLNEDLSSIDDRQQQNQQKKSDQDKAPQYNRNESKGMFSVRSVAESCISGFESIRMESLNYSDEYSSNESDSEERRRKKRKEKFDGKKAMKLDPQRKCYVFEQSPKYPLIATPRPLAKRSNYCNRYDDSESDSDDSSSDLSSSDDSYDECLSPNDVVVKDVIRMSTCSNDSGFEGGGTAPLSPKKMLGKHSIKIANDVRRNCAKEIDLSKKLIIIFIQYTTYNRSHNKAFLLIHVCRFYRFGCSL